MNEEPTDDAGKSRLLEEVKNRAKGAFQQKDMVSAELLYGKAIKILETCAESLREAPLYSNRSMCRLNLNKIEGALEDANACLAVDPKFSKGYYRKAQALVRQSEWDDAIAAAEEGFKLDPANKAFTELVDKAKQDKEKDVKDKELLRSEAQDVSVQLHNASTSRQAHKKVKKEGEDGEDLSMRGYKTTADGKKTSYFHTDISDEAKQLIAAQGFGKPQKLEEGAAVAADEAKGGGSQWNQAGTYEEKGMMKWLEERLTAELKDVVFELPASIGCGSISATGVSGVSGDANISVSRGKRRHLMDVKFDLEFVLAAQNGADMAGKGKLAYSEVTVDVDDGFEVEFVVDTCSNAGAREVLNNFVKPAGQGFQPLVSAALQKVIDEYKTK